MRVWDLQLHKFVSRLTTPGGFELQTASFEENVWNKRAFGRMASFSADGSLYVAKIVSALHRGQLCLWDTASGTVVATLSNAIDMPGEFEHCWSSDGKHLIVRIDNALRCFEITLPALGYDLGQAIKSLALSKSGSLLAVNDHVCEVVPGGQQLSLERWKQVPEGLFPQFVGNDQYWALSTRPVSTLDWKRNIVPVAANVVGLAGAPMSPGPLLAYGTLPSSSQLLPLEPNQTVLWQLAPDPRQSVLPALDYAELVKLEKTMAPMKRLGSWRFAGLANNRGAFSPIPGLLLRSGTGEYHWLEALWTDFARNGAYRINQTGVVFELWNYQSGQLLASWPDYLDWFAFSPDGRRFAKNVQGHLEVWNVASCQLERALFDRKDNMPLASTAIFSPDGRFLLARYIWFLKDEPQHRAGLFEVDSGKEVLTWKIKFPDWQAFAISPDGQFVVAGGQDKLIHLWDIATGRELARWQGHDSDVTALLFGSDNLTVYSGSLDGSFRVWSLAFLRTELKRLKLDW
jgi:WD40 repeat protein